MSCPTNGFLNSKLVILRWVSLEKRTFTFWCDSLWATYKIAPDIILKFKFDCWISYYLLLCWGSAVVTISGHRYEIAGVSWKTFSCNFHSITDHTYYIFRLLPYNQIKTSSSFLFTINVEPSFPTCNSLLLPHCHFQTYSYLLFFDATVH